MNFLGVLEMLFGAAMLYAGVSIAAQAHRTYALLKGHSDYAPPGVIYTVRLTIPLGVYFGLQGAIHLLKGGLSLIGG